MHAKLTYLSSISILIRNININLCIKTALNDLDNKSKCLGLRVKVYPAGTFFYSPFSFECHHCHLRIFYYTLPLFISSFFT